MRKTIVLIHIFIFWTMASWASGSIILTGSRYKISLDNPVELTAHEKSNQWLNREHFTKLAFTEHSRPGEEIRRQILNSVQDSLNQFELDEFAGLKNGSNLILVKSLIADTEFLRLFKIISDNNTSAVVNLSMPLSHAEQYKTDIGNMLSSVQWKAINLLTISEEPPFQLTPPVGFYVHQKYKNSLVLRSSEENTLLPEANLVLSIIPEDAEAQDLLKKTQSILEQSKSLEKFRISDISEKQSQWGDMVLARVSARYDATQIEVDISHVTLKLDGYLLIAQILIERNTESFLKLEDIMMQTLSNLIHKNQTGEKIVW